VDSKWQENQDPSGRANEAHVKADTEIAGSKYLSFENKDVLHLESVFYAKTTVLLIT
jgi:hypothetical protein